MTCLPLQERCVKVAGEISYDGILDLREYSTQAVKDAGQSYFRLGGRHAS